MQPVINFQSKATDVKSWRKSDFSLIRFLLEKQQSPE